MGSCPHWPLCGVEIPTELRCRSPRTVPRRIALDAPALGERAQVHHVEPELIDQLRDGALGLGVIPRNGECPPVGVPAGWRNAPGVARAYAASKLGWIRDQRAKLRGQARKT